MSMPGEYRAGKVVEEIEVCDCDVSRKLRLMVLLTIHSLKIDL